MTPHPIREFLRTLIPCLLCVIGVTVLMVLLQGCGPEPMPPAPQPEAPQYHPDGSGMCSPLTGCAAPTDAGAD